tara:strand:+ start:157 stop:411 length:255 start_codon:yes stop_codon:yes gene_type:complete
MKLEVEIQVPVYVTVKVEIDATKSEIRELYDLDRDDDIEDYYVDYVEDQRFDEVMDDVELDDLNALETDVSEDGHEIINVREVK